MNDTGMKMTTRHSVVASTGSAISAVACRAASNGDSPFSSMNRKMFSSTTMASSMTMPTIKTSASIVTLFSVKSSAAIMPKVAMTDAGMATAAIDRGPPVAHESEDDQAGEDAAEHQVLVDLLQRRLDVARLIADDLEPDSRRQFGLGERQVGLHRLDDLDRVGADLPPHLEHHRGHAVQPGQAPLLLGPVLGAADVADAQRHAVHRPDRPDR